MSEHEARYHVLVVCLGNICRSPIARAVLEDRFRQAGLDHLVTVDSAGTGGWHAGRGADPRAKSAMARAGYSTAHTARQVTDLDFERFDLILGMDYSNVQDLRGMVTDNEAAAKVLIYRSFDPALMHLPEDAAALEVPDPYYSDDVRFDQVLALIEDAAEGVVDHVRLEVG